jgi:Fe-S oxidoreductase
VRVPTDGQPGALDRSSSTPLAAGTVPHDRVTPASSGAVLLSVDDPALIDRPGLGDPGLYRAPVASPSQRPSPGAFGLGRWLRTRLRGADTPSSGERDFSHEVYTTMNGCLGCRTCASDCPLKLQLPDLKPQFVALYHRRHPHSLRDHLVADFEALVRWLGYVPRLSNSVLAARPFRWGASRLLGIVNPPLLSEQTLRRGLHQRRARPRPPRALALSSPSVVLVQDVFTTYFDPEVVLAFHDLLREVGHRVGVLPFRPNGNALKIRGFAEAFQRTADRNATLLAEAAALGVPLVGIDPAVTLTYRTEYRRTNPPEIKVLLLQEWLVSEQTRIRELLERRGYRPPASKTHRLLVHCSERDATTARDLWQQAFAIFGLELGFFGSGCCRASGTSACTSWQTLLPERPELRRHYLATGFSCRRQIAAAIGGSLRHPAEVLLEAVVTNCAGQDPRAE